MIFKFFKQLGDMVISLEVLESNPVAFLVLATSVSALIF